MKSIEEVIKDYPSSFIVAQVVKRKKSGAVEDALPLGRCDTKYEAFVQQSLYQLLGVDTVIFLPCAIDDNTDDDSQSPPSELLKPEEYARLFRQFYHL